MPGSCLLLAREIEKSYAPFFMSQLPFLRETHMQNGGQLLLKMQDKLKENLEVKNKTLEIHRQVLESIASFQKQLEQKTVEENVLIPIGCGYCVQAQSINPQRICILVGADTYVDFSLSEAIDFLNGRANDLQRKIAAQNRNINEIEGHIALISSA
jgi:prefoldin subunit 5